MSYSYLFPLICISSKGSHIYTVTFAYNNRDSFFSVAVKSWNSNQQLSTATCDQGTHCAMQRLTNSLGEKAGTTTVKEQPAMFVRASFSTFLRCRRSVGRSVAMMMQTHSIAFRREIDRNRLSLQHSANAHDSTARIALLFCRLALFGGAPTTKERPTKQR